jgi:hypothetical protein
LHIDHHLSFRSTAWFPPIETLIGLLVERVVPMIEKELA